jgi:hypothetical protein
MSAYANNLSSPELIDLTSVKVPDLVIQHQISARRSNDQLYPRSIELSNVMPVRRSNKIKSPPVDLPLEIEKESESPQIPDTVVIEETIEYEPMEDQVEPMEETMDDKSIYPNIDLNSASEYTDDIGLPPLQETSPKPLSPGKIAAFSPPKEINVKRVSDHTLRSKLKSEDYDIREMAVKELERRIMIMEGKCPDDIVDNLRVRIFQLEPSTIREYMDQPYDHNFQDGIGCLIDALLAPNVSDPAPDENLRQWITDIKQIGDETTEGKVFNLRSGNFPLFAVKVPENPEQDNLPHEAIIGMGAINFLRDRTPNFMHTYGSFMCTPPILDEYNRVVSWCPNGKTNKITYLILENIVDAESLESMAPTITSTEFLQVYLQILNSLNLAYKKYDFTHYDLHAGNVLIQKLPYLVSIPLYHPNGRTLYIKTNLLARIIDYGMSHVQIEGQHFGTFGLEHFEVFPDKSFPMQDAYKLLMFTYSNHLYPSSENRFTLRTDPNLLLPVVEIIYRFFDEYISPDRRVRNRLENQAEDYFQLSYTKYGDRTFDDLIVYILGRTDTSFIATTQPVDAISTTCQDNCISWDTFNRQIFNQNRLPRTIHEYCMARTAIQRLTDTRYKNELNQWLNQFNIENAYLRERDDFIIDLNDTIAEFNSVNLKYSDFSDLESYQTDVYKLVQLREQFLKYDKWLTGLTCTLEDKAILPTLYDDISLLMGPLQMIEIRFADLKAILEYNLRRFRYEFDHDLVLAHQVLLS